MSLIGKRSILQMNNIRGSASSVVTDPSFSSVVLLAHNNNPGNGTTTVTDQSTSAKTVSVFGNAQYSTAQAPTGMTSSWLLDGTGDYATLADSADWNLGSSAWTVEMFIRFVSLAGYQVFMSQGTVGSDPGLGIYKTITTNGLQVYQGATDVGRAWSPSVDTWYYLAVRNTGSAVQFWVDGTQVGADIAVGTVPDSAATLRLGTETTSYFNGYMGPMRITKGVSRTVSSIPTLPFPTS